MHSNTRNITPKSRECILNTLMSTLKKEKSDYLLYMLGSTHADKRLLNEYLFQNRNIEVYFIYPWLKLMIKRKESIFIEIISTLFFFIPTPITFFVKLFDASPLKEIILEFDAPSVYEIYYFDAKYKDQILELASKDPDLNNVLKIIEEDPYHIFIEIDSDSPTSPTGFSLRYSIGRDVQNSVLWALNRC